MVVVRGALACWRVVAFASACERWLASYRRSGFCRYPAAGLDAFLVKCLYAPTLLLIHRRTSKLLLRLPLSGPLKLQLLGLALRRLQLIHQRL